MDGEGMNNIRLDCEAFRRISPVVMDQTTIFTEAGRTNRAKVKSFIKRKPGLNNKQLAEHLNMELWAVTDITQKLVDQKLIKRGPRELYNGRKLTTFFIVE